MKILKLFSIFLAFLSLTHAADVGGQISQPKGGKIVANFDFTKMKVLLKGEEQTYVTYIYTNGLFKFTNVPVGKYILSIDDIDHFFDSAAVQIFNHKDKEIVRAYKYDIKSGKGKQIRHPVVFTPLAKKQYYEIKEPFNILSLFKNPMILMMVVSLGLVFLMNKMPKPSKEEMADMNKNMGSLPSFLGGASGT